MEKNTPFACTSFFSLFLSPVSSSFACTSFLEALYSCCCEFFSFHPPKATNTWSLTIYSSIKKIRAAFTGASTWQPVLVDFKGSAIDANLIFETNGGEGSYRIPCAQSLHLFSKRSPTP